MAFSGVLLALLLQAGAVVAAVVGLVRVAQLRAFADDVRLRRLGWFFGLLASAVGLQLLVSTFVLGQVAAGGSAVVAGRQLQTLMLLHHVLLLAALVLALRTWAVPWHAPAVVAPVFLPGLLLGHAGHYVLLNLAEAVLTLYLAVASGVNQWRRRNKGALRVAAAFLLLFLGQFAFALWLHHGAVRPYWGEGLALAGTWLLAAAVPRRTP